MHTDRFKAGFVAFWLLLLLFCVGNFLALTVGQLFGFDGEHAPFWQIPAVGFAILSGIAALVGFVYLLGWIVEKLGWD